MSAEPVAARRLALLIDADNISAKHVTDAMKEAATLGTITVRRMYGDWTTPNLTSWKSVVADYAIRPVQQFTDSKGKNSTDAAMIIDAMDLLHSGKVDGSCLVSSDSDFTALASRIRNEGLAVLGFGEERTPRALIAACDKSVFVELLQSGAEGKMAMSAQSAGFARTDPKGNSLASLIVEVVEKAADEIRWMSLAALGCLISQQHPEVDPRGYGHKKLRTLVESLGMVDVEERMSPAGHRHVWVRSKPQVQD